MPIKSLFFLIIFVSLFSCNSTKHERPVEKNLTHERTAPKTDDWDRFWKTFSTAVQQQDVKKVAGMTRLPLPSAIEGAEISKEKFTQEFHDLFDEKTVEAFINATDRDFRPIPSNKELSGHMKTPIGIELKTIHVQYVSDQGTESQTESSKLFIFGEVEGKYKLLTLVIAG